MLILKGNKMKILVLMTDSTELESYGFIEFNDKMELFEKFPDYEHIVECACDEVDLSAIDYKAMFTSKNYDKYLNTVECYQWYRNGIDDLFKNAKKTEPGEIIPSEFDDTWTVVLIEK